MKGEFCGDYGVEESELWGVSCKMRTDTSGGICIYFKVILAHDPLQSKPHISHLVIHLADCILPLGSAIAHDTSPCQQCDSVGSNPFERKFSHNFLLYQ